MEEAHRRFGPVVDLGYGSARMILLFGVEANEHVLAKAAHTFEWGEAMQALVAVDGPTALVVSDSDDHRQSGQTNLPAELRQRWGLQEGGDVGIVDLGGAASIVPRLELCQPVRSGCGIGWSRNSGMPAKSSALQV